MKRPTIPEHLLQRVWNDHAKYLVDRPKLADGTPIEILDPGEFNQHRGGPDFLNARISLDSLALSGDIELHKEAGMWHDHGHDNDHRYGKVMLHVVLEDSESDAGPHVPTLILKNNLRFDRAQLWEELFRSIYDRSPELACFPHNIQFTTKYKRRIVEKFGEARLDELIARFDHDTLSERASIDRVYEGVMDAIGYSENRTPFKELARLLPLTLLREVRERVTADRVDRRMEALFFGVAGLLPQPSTEFDAETNERVLDLRSEWELIQLEHSIPEVLAESDWAFFRIRPMNSPERRVALAAMLAARVFGLNNLTLSHPFFLDPSKFDLGSDPFWQERTSFGKPLEKPHDLLGKERAKAMELSVLIPARIAAEPDATARKALRRSWGERTSAASAKYLDVIRQELLESENVKTVRFEQGALFLKRNFCDLRRCTECPIGQRLIGRGWEGPR